MPPRGLLIAIFVRLAVVPRSMYEVGLGRLLGHRLLLVKPRGGQGGKGRRQVLEVVSWDPEKREATAIAGFGRRGNETIDALESEGTEVLLGGERFDSRLRRVEGSEAFDTFSDFEHRNRLLMPLTKPVVSRLAGFPYDGSAESRRRLLERMPLIGLRDEAQPPRSFGSTSRP